jgi:hypothetical protein
MPKKRPGLELAVEDFYEPYRAQSTPLHPYVTSRFSDRDTSFLFIGFGFRHWYMRILLHVLKAGEHTAPSLALEDAGFFTLPDQRQTVLFFQSGHFVDFLQLPWQDFARELRQRFERQMQSERSVQPARRGNYRAPQTRQHVSRRIG